MLDIASLTIFFMQRLWVFKCYNYFMAWILYLWPTLIVDRWFFASELIAFLNLRENGLVSSNKHFCLMSLPSSLDLSGCSISLKRNIIFYWKLDWFLFLDLHAVILDLCHIDVIFVLKRYVQICFCPPSVWTALHQQRVLILHQFLDIDLFYSL